MIKTIGAKTLIHATLRYDSGPSVVRNVIRALCSLSGSLRPKRHRFAEDSAGQPIGDIEKFLDSLDARPSFMLRGKRLDYDITMGRGDVLICDCYFKATPPSLVRTFMEAMASTGGAFGRACAWEELLHRNELVVKVDGGRLGTSHDFVGRDHSKFVPGLYWLVLLPQSLAEKHGVPLEQVVDAATEHVALGGGQHLFRFYDHPGDWHERTDAMDVLCKRLPGVFDINEVRRLFAGGCRDLSELTRMTRPWE